MANLTITAANIVAVDGADIEHGTAGAAITPGQPVYRDTAGKYQLADSNSATAAAKRPRGISLNTAATNQPLAIIKEGDLDMGAILTAGQAYYLGDTAGAIQPAADLASEDVIQLGIARTTSRMAVKILIPGVTLA
jgi:hypothetical protein